MQCPSDAVAVTMDTGRWGRVDEILRTLPLTWNARPEVNGKGCVLGAVVSKSMHAVCVHSTTTKFKDVLSELISLLKEVGVIMHDTLFSSIQFLRNAQISRHTDSNASLSTYVTTRDFSNGRLMICDEPVVEAINF